MHQGKRVFFTSIYLQHQAERERLAKVELARVDGLRRVLPAHLWTPFLSWGSSGKIFGVSFTMW